MKQDSVLPVLAGHAGAYREYPLAPALQRHFSCIWSNAIRRDHTGVVAVVPDGCVDLLWIEGGLLVAGPDEVAGITTLTPGKTVVGIRFQPGAAMNWLGLPMSEIVGARVDLGDLWGVRAQDLAGRVGDAGTLAGRLRQLEAALCALAPDIDPPESAMEFVFRTLARPSGSDMTTIRDRLDISERSLRRHCHEAFGYGPKTLDRILRFQRFLRLARSPGETGLSALAFDAGYADQAHLTREVRRLSRLSPSMILRQVAA